MSGPEAVEILDVTDDDSFALLPPCADGRFDHRSCDYWEDAVRGSKAARPSWWRPEAEPVRDAKPSTAAAENPFAPSDGDEESNPFSPQALASLLDPVGGDDLFATPASNPFAPTRPVHTGPGAGGLRKLRLLRRGLAVFGSYAKVLSVSGEPAAYAQFGPLSAFPRAQQSRDLYPQLPQSPLPAVITCIATTPQGRGRGLARRLVEDVCRDLAQRGFSAVEAYPDTGLEEGARPAAHPAFWLRCGFTVAAEDERFPVMRRELE